MGREPRRLIRSELETALASVMLGGIVEDSDKVRVTWLTHNQKVTFGKLEGTEGEDRFYKSRLLPVISAG